MLPYGLSQSASYPDNGGTLTDDAVGVTTNKYDWTGRVRTLT